MKRTLLRLARWISPPLLWLKTRMRNRYVRVAALAVIWMLFFDRYDVTTLVGLRQKVTELEKDKAFYQAEIERLKSERDLFETNLQEVERIARENYLMKRADEDLFIIAFVEKD